jgi:hypothetical protein
MRKFPSMFVGVFVLAAATSGQPQTVSMHVTRVTTHPEGGFTVEAKLNATYYTMTCDNRMNGCLRMHAGNDYEGKILSAPNLIEQFVPANSPKIPSHNQDGTASEIVVGYTIESESETACACTCR